MDPLQQGKRFTEAAFPNVDFFASTMEDVKTEAVQVRLRTNCANKLLVNKVLPFIENDNHKTLTTDATSKSDTVTDKCDSDRGCSIRNQTSVYKKRRADAVLKDSSIRGALLNWSPQWVKTLLNEPELFLVTKRERVGGVVHQQSDSLFSTSSGFTNYRGLLNLCIILLALSNARLFLENIIKYGILIDPIQWIHMFSEQPYSWPNVGIVLLSNVFILGSFYMEVAMSKSWLAEKTAMGLQSVLLIMLLVIPAAVILYLHPNPVFSVVTLGMYTMLFMKLVSYHSVNRWCRQVSSPKRTRVKRSKSISISSFGGMANGKEETMLVVYPDNLNYNDMYYFVFAPTLCYELNFPRSLRIRKRFLLKRIIEMLFLSQLMIGCIQQWMVPTVQNAMKPLTDMNLFKSLERLLKLAIPNHFIWLMFFYWFFHSTLNVVAELLKFGDREFYSDWWNSNTVNEFWKAWNIPVHRWASRHLYKPLVRRGYSRMKASVAVFFLSAFFHEYMLSVPLKMFRVWAFSAMLGQVPLALLQTKYMQGKYGNMVVWLSLILGQPVAILAYFHDYYVIHTTPGPGV